MKLKLIKKIEEAPSTYSFYFETDEKISFDAGQYLYIDVPELKYQDERGKTRHFTISSTPNDNLIRITTRIRQESGYKKTLNEAEIGTIFEARGPFGSFIIEKKDLESKKTNIFLAGGIGITPFISLMKNNFEASLKINEFLIYSNSDSNFVFKNEIDELCNKSSDFIKVKYVDTTILGRISKEIIEESLLQWQADSKNVKFWVVGPNAFVDGMEELLQNMEIPEDNIKTEKFTGY